jgi:hypothetical protein
MLFSFVVAMAFACLGVQLQCCRLSQCVALLRWLVMSKRWRILDFGGVPAQPDRDH